MKDIFLQSNPRAVYPAFGTAFHPGVAYPEYPWSKGDLSPAPNDAYHMVRECLIGLGLDEENAGTANWNPLGSVIHHGDTVLLKPNWVSHRNKNPDVHDRLECLVTHPAVVRAVFDYVCIALQGSGRIIIADAPMQGTDLDALFDTAGYREFIAFVREKTPDTIIADLRKYRVTDCNGVLSKPIGIKNSPGSVLVDTAGISAHGENDHRRLNYKVSDYLSEETNAYHHAGRHAYEVNRYVLEADVIINLPKPKCHRLAGLTGAMKNLVGILYDKASLPHRAEGAAETGAGDSYAKRSLLKHWMWRLEEQKIHHERRGAGLLARASAFGVKACYWLSRAFTGDAYRVGGWYGNDTIWRTVADLHHLVIHADLNGRLQPAPQRKVFTIGDMIVCGEKDGPIGPSPKPLGIVMASADMVLFDRVLCEIMGFDQNKIKSLGWIASQHSASVRSPAILGSNIPELNNSDAFCVDIPSVWHFEPHSCWKGHIERR